MGAAWVALQNYSLLVRVANNLHFRFVNLCVPIDACAMVKLNLT